MRIDMNRQAQIDKMMCKPGYTWNETLQRCIGGYAPPKNDGGKGNVPKPTKPTPDDAISLEIASRENTGEVL